MLHKSIFILFLLFPFLGWAQPGAVSTNNLTGAGTYNCTALTDYGSFRQARIQAGTGSAGVTWEFPASCAFPGDVWRPYTSGTTAVPFNTVMDPSVSANSARWNGSNGGSSGTLATTTVSNYYTFNVQDVAATNNAFMAVLQTTYNPVAISSVSPVGNSATINVTLAGAKNAAENIYIRWHTGAGFGSATITQVTTLLSGNTYTVNLPGLTNGQTVTYYVFTSNQAIGSLTNANADYFTLNILNNGTANYSYVYGANTYYWVGGATGSLSTSTTTVLSTSLGGSATNVTLSTLDKIIFDGSCLSAGCGVTGAVTVTGASAISIGQLVLQNNVNVTYSASSTSNNVTINGGTGTDLDVPGGSTLYFPSTSSTISTTLLTGCTGSISGTLGLGAAVGTGATGAGGCKLIGTDASSIIFNSGSICNINLSGSAGIFPFGSGTDGSVIFTNGSKMVHERSDYIFGGTTKNIITFQSGSTYEFSGASATYFAFRQQATGGTPSARVFSNVVLNPFGASSFAFNSGVYGSNITVDSFIVKSSLNANCTGLTMQDDQHTLTIKGNLSNYSTRVLTFATNLNNVTATINFAGSGTQYILNTSGLTNGISFGSTSSTNRQTLVNINSGATVKMGSGTAGGDFTLLSLSGSASFTTFTVKTGGTLDMGTSVIYGASATTGGTFTIETGGTVKTGHLSGLSTTAATGSVQTQVKNYHSSANYAFNGTTGAQVTGNFIGSTAPTANTVNNLTIDNNSGVTFNIASGTVNVTGTLFLTNGIFNTITNNATAVIPSGATVTRTNGWVYGSLQKYVSGSTGFEVGDNLYYTSVTVGGTISTPGLFTAKTNANGDHPNIGTSDMDATKSENTYWTLTNNTVTFSSGASLTFNYPSADIDLGATATNFKQGRYSAGSWTYPSPATPAANSISVTGITTFGDFQAAEAGCGAFGTWKGTVSTDWNNPANWCGGVPTIYTDVIIPNAANQPLISTADASAKTVTINSGSSLTMSGIYNLTLAGNSFTNNAGASGFNAAASTGAVIFTSATAAVSGTTTFQNVTITNSGLDFGTASTVNGTFKINSGGYVSNNHPPVYACTSTLLYNNGGTYNRGSEWKSGVSAGQAGYPGNVQLSTAGTSLNYGSTAASICGSLTIDAGTTLDMGSSASNALTVSQNVTTNGTLKLSTGSGGDLYVGGNYTVGAAGSVINNNRATFFNGASGTQTILKTGGGTVFFDYMIVNKASGDVQLTGTPGNLTNVQINSSTNNASLYVLQLQSGDIDLNDQDFTLNGTTINSTNIFTSGTGIRRIYTSSGTGNFNITGTALAGSQNLNVNRASASSSLTFDANVTVTTTVGVDFGPSGMTLVNSIFQINNNGFCINNSPTYGSASTLVYNNGSGGFNRNVEWNNNASGTGYPNNIIVQNNTPLTLDVYSFGAAGLGCSGYIDIKSGSSILMGALNKNLTVGKDLTISGTLTLSTVAGGDIFVGGSWTRTGTFIQNGRNVTFNGSLDGTITATGGQEFSNVYVSKNAKANKIVLADNVSVTKEIGFTKGTVDLGTNNKFLSILSNASYDGRVAQSDSANTAFIYGASDNAGQFIVQRYVPARRAWRLVAAPFKPGGGTHSISQAWQEQGNGANGRDYTSANWAASVSADTITAGFGTQITGGTSANGFDLSPLNNSSIKYFTGAGTWSTPVNTNTTNVNSQEGWLLFVRGDRKNFGEITNQYKTPTITTLRPRGQIFLGQKTITASGMQTVGNPYASAVDYFSMTRTGSGWPASPTYYVWDPSLGGSQGVGAFVTLTWNGTNFTRSSPYGAGNYDDRYIPSGAAIMVDFPSGGGTLSMNESNKNTDSNTTAFRPVRQLMTVLQTKDVDNSVYVADGTLSLFGDDFNNDADIDDARKLSNINENICLRRGNGYLSIERKKLNADADTLFYYMSKLQRRAYQLKFVMNDLHLPSTTTAFLEDMYLKKKTPVNITGETVVDFNVTADAGSAAADRFRLVFRRSVVYAGIKAAVNDNNDVDVNWIVSSEWNIHHYEIERSTNGTSFKLVASAVSKGESTSPVEYSTVDAQPLPGEYYYRIKSISSNGVITCSNVVKVKVVKASPALYVFPNPVVNSTIQLQMNKAAAGVYAIRLFAPGGEVVYTSSFNHAGGTITKMIQPSQQLSAGTYQLTVISPGNITSLIKVLVVNE